MYAVQPILLAILKNLTPVGSGFAQLLLVLLLLLLIEQMRDRPTDQPTRRHNGL